MSTLDDSPAATNTTTSSTTLVGDVDGQALTKSSDFSIAFTVTITYA